VAFLSRPTIKPWLPRVWRDGETLQIGAQPDIGVVVAGVDAGLARWLGGLDGSRAESEVLAEATAAGLDVATARALLSGLNRSGVLLPGPVDALQLEDSGPLLPELVNLTAVHASSQHGNQALTARARRHVVIDGANRVGVPLGALLAASGVGRLSFLDTEPVRRCDAGVGGLSLDDEGKPRVGAALQAVRRISTAEHMLTDPEQHSVDLHILCQPWTAHDPLQARGLTDQIAHLAVAVRSDTVVIGPLVVPGRTSCLQCAEMHRTDRDPRWPTVAAQLVATSNRAMHQPTSLLAALAAALAAGQVLDHLDGLRSPAVLDATLELHPPDWQLHRRLWPPHPDCDCLAAGPPEARSSG